MSCKQIQKFDLRKSTRGTPRTQQTLDQRRAVPCKNNNCTRQFTGSILYITDCTASQASKRLPRLPDEIHMHTMMSCKQIQTFDLRKNIRGTPPFQKPCINGQSPVKASSGIYAPYSTQEASPQICSELTRLTQIIPVLTVRWSAPILQVISSHTQIPC